MAGKSMFARMLLRSLVRRRLRLSVAVLAVTLGAVLVAALTSLSLDVGAKVGRSLRNYGANIVLSPRVGTLAVGSGSLGFGGVDAEQYLSESALAPLGTIPGVAGYLPYLYGTIAAGRYAGDLKPVILAGTRLDDVPRVSPWWQITGRWPTVGDERSAMIGTNVARAFSLAPGDEFVMRYGQQTTRILVAGIVDSGGSEDGQIVVPLSVAQSVLQRPGAIALVQVSALATDRSLTETASDIERAVPESQAKIIGQIAEAEEKVFAKIQLLIGLVAALVLLAAALAVASTMTTSVLERTPEIGLLKALGATSRRIAALFFAESAFIGLSGGILGFALGLGVANLISSSVFGAALTPHWLALPATALVSVAVALVASLAPVRRALAVDPIVTLRGE